MVAENDKEERWKKEPIKTKKSDTYISFSSNPNFNLQDNIFLSLSLKVKQPPKIPFKVIHIFHLVSPKKPQIHLFSSTASSIFDSSTRGVKWI